MREFKNEKHNEVAELEDRLSSLYNGAIEISNWLYSIDPDHPALEEISGLVSYIEQVEFEAYYEDEKEAAGESWWDEEEK